MASLDKELPEDVKVALEALTEETWRERKEASVNALNVVSRYRGDPATIDKVCLRLMDGLLSDQVHGRAAFQEVVVGLGHDCVPHVLTLIDQGGPAECRLIDVLGEIAKPEDLQPLLRRIRDASADPNVRAASASAAGRVGGAQAEQALIELLQDPSEMLRTYALEALRVAGSVVSVATLQPLLTSPVTRKSATILLGRGTVVDALPVLVPLVMDAMPGVRSAAAVTLSALAEAMNERGQPGLVRNILTSARREVFDAIRELIGHRDPDVRSAAVRLATIAKDADVLPFVLAVMDDLAIQELATALVGELGPAANAALVFASSNVETGRRVHLFRLIGAMRVDVIDPRLIALLIEGLSAGDEDTAVAAAEALRYVGGRQALGALYRSMDQDGPLGAASAHALADILVRVGGARHDDLTLMIGASWPQRGPLARHLCLVAGRLGTAEFVPQLVMLLGSSDVSVRVASANALGDVPGEHEGVSALSFALADEEPQVRAAACRSLGLLQPPQAYQSLLGATSDPSPLVRTAAVQALVQLDNPIGLTRLRAVIAEDPVPSVVVQAIVGLGASRLEQDLSMLMSLCTSEDHEVVKAAARALAGYPAHRATAALLGLMDHPRWDIRRTAAEVIARRGDVDGIGAAAPSDGPRDGHVGV